MTLKKLPELQAKASPKICNYELDSAALDKWNVGISADAADNTISILDTIGADWNGEGVTAKRISAALRQIGGQDVVVDINSPGGDFFEGVAIYNMLRAHPHKVTVRVLGIAASAASVIAMAGDEIHIAANANIMVHNAWVIAIGNRHDLTEAAATMEPFDTSMAELYAERAGVGVEKAAEWMDAETWFTGEAAIEAGLADELIAKGSIKESKAKAKEGRAVNAIRQLDTLLAKQGMSRSERRALLSDAKGGTQDAAPTVMHDADTQAAFDKLILTLKS